MAEQNGLTLAEKLTAAATAAAAVRLAARQTALEVAQEREAALTPPAPAPASPGTPGAA